MCEEKQLNHFRMAGTGEKVNFISYLDLIKWTICLYQQLLHAPPLEMNYKSNYQKL